MRGEHRTSPGDDQPDTPESERRSLYAGGVTPGNEQAVGTVEWLGWYCLDPDDSPVVDRIATAYHSRELLL